MSFSDPSRRDPATDLFTPGAVAVGLLAVLALRRAGTLGLIGAALGGAWAWQSWRNRTGRVPTHVLPRLPLSVHRAVAIQRPRSDVFRFWRDPTRFSQFMSHVDEVREIGPDAHHWIVRGPLGTRLEWDADLVDIREDEHIGWRARPGADVGSEGSVRFTDLPGGGTEVHLTLTYDAPGGKAGAAVARLLGEEPDRQARDDLHRLKRLLEGTGAGGVA